MALVIPIHLFFSVQESPQLKDLLAHSPLTLGMFKKTSEKIEVAKSEEQQRTQTKEAAGERRFRELLQVQAMQHNSMMKRLVLASKSNLTRE